MDPGGDVAVPRQLGQGLDRSAPIEATPIGEALAVREQPQQDLGGGVGRNRHRAQLCRGISLTGVRAKDNDGTC